MTPLKGQALLDYLTANEGQARDAVIEGAGYVIIRGGRPSLQRSKFLVALAEANGHKIITPFRSGATVKPPNYRLKVGASGLVPVSGAYTHQCNMPPGSYVKVIIEDGVIILEPEEPASLAAVGETTTPVAQIASLA